MLSVPVINQSPHPLPVYQSRGAAGADIHAWLKEPVCMPSGARKIIETGLYVALPEGYEMQVRPRSGLAWKHGVTVLNAPGTIDSDYRGELKVLLWNTSQTAFWVEDGMRIAQLVVAPCLQVQWQPQEQLLPTARHDGGYGHTGT